MNDVRSLLSPSSSFFRAAVFALLLLGLCRVPSALAGGIEQLNAFIKETRAARASFTQIVVDAEGTTLQDSSGVVEFSRPGKFRWHYVKPFEQLVVGDGTNLWVYDKDLAQVTKRKLGAALGSSPAALLAGSDDVDRHFSMEALGKEGAASPATCHVFIFPLPDDPARRAAFGKVITVIALQLECQEVPSLGLDRRTKVLLSKSQFVALRDGLAISGLSTHARRF